MRGLAALVVLVVMGTVWPAAVSAQQHDPAPALIKERIGDILSNPPFGAKRDSFTYQYRWEEEEDESEPTDFDWSWLKWLFDWVEWLSWLSGNVVWSLEVILWTLLIALVLLLVIFHKRWLPHLLQRRLPPAPTLPSALFGKDQETEPLPDDIVGRARERWLKGDVRGCLSLLYRGALLRIILSRRIQLPDSATEEDCLREVIPVESAERAGYFQSLTRCWQSTAYAARSPASNQTEELLDDWQRHFGGSV